MAIPDFSSHPVVVTGGAGFIGSHLVDALVDGGAQVRVLDDLSSGKRANLEHHGAGVELITGDIRDLDTCRRALRGARYVFHQAARGSVPRSLAEPNLTLDINVGGTATVFTAARDEGVERIVYASSSSVYGDSAALPKREGEEGAPLSPYAASKKMNEDLALVFGRCFDLTIVGLRYFNVYGPRQDPKGAYAAVIPRFFSACLAGEAPVIYGDGEQSRDFTFVADAVRANLLAAGAPKAAGGRAFNVAAGRRTTVNELAQRVRSAAGRGLEAQHEPPRPGDVAHSLASLEAAGEVLGYRAGLDLEQGLERSREHYAALTAAG
ncbi:MAG: NAD-dependent epimerase/dehydratase family protein [Acidobacteriota bacterium]